MSTLRNASRVVTIPAITKGNFEYYVQVEGFQFDYCITDAVGNVYTLNALSANKSASINSVYTFSQSPVVPIATHSDEAINKGQMDAADEYLFDLIADVEATIPQPNDGILSLNTTGLTNTQTSFSANQATDSTFTIHIPDSLSAFNNDSGFITSNALNGYATQNWVNQQGYLTQLPTHQHIWSQITDTPTTLSGYGITNAMSTGHVANAITASNINSWNQITNHGLLQAQTINNNLTQSNSKAFLNLNLYTSAPSVRSVGDIVWFSNNLYLDYGPDNLNAQYGYRKLTGLQPDMSTWGQIGVSFNLQRPTVGFDSVSDFIVTPYIGESSGLTLASTGRFYNYHPDMKAGALMAVKHAYQNESAQNGGYYRSNFYFDCQGDGYLGWNNYTGAQAWYKIWSEKHFTLTDINNWNSSYYRSPIQRFTPELYVGMNDNILHLQGGFPYDGYGYSSSITFKSQWYGGHVLSGFLWRNWENPEGGVEVIIPTKGTFRVWTSNEIPITTINRWNHLANTIQNYYTKNEALNLFVGLNGVQTIYNTKTFIESPVIPVATLPNHAVNKAQLDEAITENWGSRDW